MKHISIPNMIDIYLLDGENAKAESLLEDYRSMIDFSNIYDMLMWNNYRLVYYRQRDDLNNLKQVYDDYREQLSGKLTHDEHLAFQMSELRMRWNNRIQWEDLLDNVCRNIDEYIKLPFPECFFAAKELVFIMKGLDEHHNHLFDSSLMAKLVTFLRKTAPDLDRYLHSLPDEFVHERFNFTKDKAWLLQIQFDLSGKSHEQIDKEYAAMLDNKLAFLDDLADIQQKAGNVVNALDARLAIPDEVIAQVFSPFTSGFFNRPQFYDYRNKLLALSKKQMDIVYGELAGLGCDVPILTFKLRLSYYFLFFNELGNAYRLFRDFEDSGISINHFAGWLRDIHGKLNSVFTALDKTGQQQFSKNV
jgi:hypothetical protein